MIINRITEGINKSRENENLLATVAKQAATIDYLAMMSDIEIPTEDGETESGVTDNE